MIKVCDAIMGSGKSSAAITYINEHPEKRFIYVTPYLEEANRIKVACPEAHFIEPSDELRQYGYRKTAHAAALIHEGQNVACTHQALLRYTPQMLEDIAARGYDLILDESLGCMGEVEIKVDDVQIAADGGLLECDGEMWRLTEDGREYNGEKFEELVWVLRSRSLVRVQDEKNRDGNVREKVLFYWIITPELFLSFQNVTILTYLFDGQELKYYLDANEIQYNHIWVLRDDDGVYRFSDTPCDPPAYVRELGRLIHIEDHAKLNSIGEAKTALSMNWMKGSGEARKKEIKQLKNHTYNFFNNLHSDISAPKRLWGACNAAYGKLRGQGYANAFLAFNSRATNKYADRTCLAYLANVYPDVSQKRFYQQSGITMDDDAYALSTMVQWIWRSAIRNGHEIYLYVPSKRMRELLVAWIASLREGGDANA